MSDFGLKKPGIVYDAGGDALNTLRQLLQPNIAGLSFAKVMTTAATIPVAVEGNNLLNVVYDFEGDNFTVFVASSKTGQEAFRDYFDQAFIQALLP